jgi:uncharacterized membrane protein (DUF4010 family)
LTPYAVLLGLSLFYGFAFEEFYAEELPNRPGGVRTFPLLAFAGAGLYLVEPRFALAFIAGLLVLGAWLYAYLRASLELKGERVEAHFVIPTAVVLAYLLGPICLSQPLWLSVSFVVGAVLLIGARKPLHGLVGRIPQNEVWTLGQFLVLVGIVLPLLYNEPAIPFTHITPFKVWLAVVAVSTLSYASYLVQRYVLPSRGVIVTAILGGLYSSTATTVVLARKARDEGMTREMAAGIVAATGMMYLRIIVVCSIFNLALGRELLVPFIALSILGCAAAYGLARSVAGSAHYEFVPSNPLQLGTALIFAVLMISVSLLSEWVQKNLGTGGILGLAAVVGFTDIDPFVLAIAQGGGAATMGLATAAGAIVIAASSNNVLKALYAAIFSRRRESWIPVGILLALSLLGAGAALYMMR